MNYLKYIVIALILFIAQGVFAAPSFRIERTLLPEVDSAYELGTSTRAWLRINADEVCLTGDSCKTVWPSAGSSFPFTSQSWGVSTSTTMGFLNGFLSTASSTINSTFRLPLLSNGMLTVYGGNVSSTATTTAGTGLTYSGNAFDVNTTQNIAKLSNLTSNGFVKTSGGDGTLSVDTASYLSSIGSGTNGQIAYWSGANTLAGVATTTLAAGTGISTSATLGNLVGGSNASLSIDQSFSPTWTGAHIFNNIIRSTTTAATTTSLFANSIASGLTANRTVCTTTGGVFTTTCSSSDISNSVSDETGTGGLVFGTSPTFTTQITTPSVTNAGTLALSATGANVITASTNGSERMRIDSSGNVGIGTASPGARLVVSTTTAGNNTLLTLNNTGGFGTGEESRLDFNGGSDIRARMAYQLFQGGPNQHGFAFYTPDSGSNSISATPRMVIRADNVGIGTVSPSSTNSGLDISSGGLSLIVGADNAASTRTNSTDKLGRIGAYHHTNSEEPSAIIVSSNTSTANNLNFGGSTGLMNAATAIQFFTAANNTTLTGTSRMIIDSSGNVGIGTASPQSLLDLSANDPTLQFTDTGGSPTRTYSLRSADGNFIVRDVTGGSDRITLSSSGNVGIGTTTPQAALSVIAGKSALVGENRLATTTTMTIDWTAGNQQLIQKGTSNITLSFSNVNDGGRLTLVGCNPGSGTAGTFTWPASVYWPGGTAPTQTTTSNKCDIYTFLATKATSTTAIVVFGGFNQNY